jgi:glycolate oxidase subunit GlcD
MPRVPAQVVVALQRIVGERWVRTARSELETYARDALPTRRSVPGVVVLPASREEVVRVVRLLAHHQVPFVARGAGTGLSGGALAGESAVLITLTRLDRILGVDAANRVAVVEPGVVNAKLSEAVAPLGLFYAPDPSSQTACTLGGNVAENAGGPHCLKYGVTANHILELEVVLPDGSVVTLGSLMGEPWGPDLVGVFVGSEGMFGIATRIAVRLSPTPPSIRTLLADFDDLPTAGKAVSAIISSGLVPAALEMMDRVCIEVVEDSIYAAGYPRDAAAVLLVELDGATDEQVTTEGAAIEALLMRHGARSVRTAADAAERARLWQGRKKAFGALGRMSPDLVVQDAVVPRSSLPKVLSEIESIAQDHDLRVGNVFHAGDGNLHPNIGYDRDNPDEVARVEQACAEIMQVCIDAGGTITGEHGVGLDKRQYMTDIFDADTLIGMARLRLVFDPAGIANPGKVLPTHACREWRQGAGRNG